MNESYGDNVPREYHDTAIEKKSGCIADLRAELDALRASLRDMVEWAEKYNDIMEKMMIDTGRYHKESREKRNSEISKARGLL